MSVTQYYDLRDTSPSRAPNLFELKPEDYLASHKTFAGGASATQAMDEYMKSVLPTAFNMRDAAVQQLMKQLGTPAGYVAGLTRTTGIEQLAQQLSQARRQGRVNLAHRGLGQTGFADRLTSELMGMQIQGLTDAMLRGKAAQQQSRMGIFDLLAKQAQQDASMLQTIHQGAYNPAAVADKIKQAQVFNQIMEQSGNQMGSAIRSAASAGAGGGGYGGSAQSLTGLMQSGTQTAGGQPISQDIYGSSFAYPEANRRNIAPSYVGSQFSAPAQQQAQQSYYPPPNQSYWRGW